MNASDGANSARCSATQFSGWEDSTSRRRSPRSRAVLHRRNRLEPNDDAGGSAARLGTRVTSVKATIDFWDDQIDVYRLYLKKDQKVKLLPSTARGLHFESAALEAGDEARERPPQPASSRRPGHRARTDARDRLQGAGEWLVLRGGQAHGPGLWTVRADDRAALEKLVRGDVAEARAGFPTTTTCGARS